MNIGNLHLIICIQNHLIRHYMKLITSVPIKILLLVISVISPVMSYISHIPSYIPSNIHMTDQSLRLFDAEMDAVSHFLLRVLCCNDGAASIWMIDAEDEFFGMRPGDGGVHCWSKINMEMLVISVIISYDDI